MSWTINGTTVKNPIYPNGFAPEDEPVGGVFKSLDGSLVPHKITTRVNYECTWRVSGSDYTNLMTALRSIHLATGTVTDHLGTSLTMTITDPIRHNLIGTTLREVTATLRETTA